MHHLQCYRHSARRRNGYGRRLSSDDDQRRRSGGSGFRWRSFDNGPCRLVDFGLDLIDDGDNGSKTRVRKKQDICGSPRGLTACLYWVTVFLLALKARARVVSETQTIFM